MSDTKTKLRKSLKSIYDDLRDAENGPDRQTFGFKHRLEVIHKTLAELEPMIASEFTELGELEILGDFASTYYHTGDSGMAQLLKSRIKIIAIDIDANLEANHFTQELIPKQEEKTDNISQKVSEKNIQEIISTLDTVIDVFSDTSVTKKVLDETIKIYDSFWKIAKNCLPSRNDMNLLKLGSVSFTRILISGTQELTDHRKELVTKSKRLKHIFENEISKAASENGKVETEAYIILKNLEQKTRNFLEIELSEINPKWWKQLIPGDVKGNAEKRKAEDEERKTWEYKEQPLISYIDFTDYEKIISQNNNWKEIFQYVFRDKTAISAKLKEIDPIRNAISHSRNLDPHEEKQLRFYSEEILRTISYYNDNKQKIKQQKAAFDETKISPRKPVIQSDKSVYLWGADMILTVIDPDAGKDSNKPEFVGDRSDSKLIIKSSRGLLENYRLRETGDSTGIFQGLIGFIGIRNDGKVEPYNYNDKPITQTQGKEVDDGFLVVAENDELKITYSNLAGTAELTVFVIHNPETSQIGF